MQIKLLLLIFILSGQLFSQTRLEIFIEKCESNVASDSLSLCILYEINGRDEVRIGEIRPMGQSLIHIDTLEPGNYKLAFPNKSKNLLGEQLFEIKGNEKTIISLCVDRFKNEIENHHSIVESLKSGESYLIQFESRGCFHLKQDSLMISNQSGVLQVIYKTKTYDLSPSQIATLVQFEWGLNDCNPSYRCSTTNYFTIVVDSVERTFIERECFQNRWYGLLTELGIPEQ